MEICYHLEPFGGGLWQMGWGGLGEGVQSSQKKFRELSLKVEADSVSPGWVVLSGKPLDPPAIHRGSRRNSLFYWSTTTVDVYCILFGRECLSMGSGRGWAEGGDWGGGRTVKTVCMSMCFLPSKWRGGTLYLYYVFYVRVNLNSWHRNIEALFKNKRDVNFCFLMLILTDVLFWVLC